MPFISDRAAAVLFIISLLFVIFASAFLLGMAVFRFRMWPYRPFNILYAHTKTFIQTGEWAPEGRFLRVPKRASRQRVVVHEPARVMPGYRAIMGWDSTAKAYTIWLLDDHGDEKHAWRIDYDALDADGPSQASDMPHGMQVLEDGSVLLNFDRGDILTRLDACGEPIWIKQDGPYHHAIARAEDGSFWTWRGEGTAYGHYQYMVNFDAATGDTLKAYSLIDDLLKGSPMAEAIFALPEGFEYSRPGDDIFHPNEVEPLPSALAGRYPAFRAGDLLLSFNEPNLVVVWDPAQRRLKWWSHGPWRLQHDPDFGPDGKIWVYNNKTVRRRSNIMGIAPETREVDVAFSGRASQFFSDSMGQHQLLPNETRLIVVPDEGRVLETTRSGELVFEFNNTFNKGYNAHVENAMWVPDDFFERFPSCMRP